MEIAGYAASLLIGLSLGLIGGGGSILTMPVLVYLFGISPLLATSYSLFIVGATSLAGAYNYKRQNLLSIKTAFLFGAASIATVFAMRKWVIPLIPEQLFNINGYAVTKSLLTMMLFAMLMLAAALKMIKRNRTLEGVDGETTVNLPAIIVYGVLIGITTGLLGAGGGFLIIPVLVLLLGLEMKKAVGTSLLIIALNSLIGFVGDWGHFLINWVFLLSVTAIAVLGIFTGSILGRTIDGEKLRKAFGWFVLFMGLYILTKEVFFNSGS